MSLQEELKSNEAGVDKFKEKIKAFAMFLISNSEPDQLEEYEVGQVEEIGEHQLEPEQRQILQIFNDLALIVSNREYSSEEVLFSKIEDKISRVIGGKYIWDTVQNSNTYIYTEDITTEEKFNAFLINFTESLRVNFGMDVANKIAEKYQSFTENLNSIKEQITIQTRVNLFQLAATEVGNELFREFK